jgi:citrate synthase
LETTHVHVRRRDETFAQRSVTKIWEEVPSAENPYLPERLRCHGYELNELMAKRSFVDVLYLLFQGELPSPEKAELLEQVMIALINPGPRHPATRAAMCAGVGKTETSQILPVAMTLLGGNHLGGGEVEEAMRFLRKEVKNDPSRTALDLLAAACPPSDGDWHPAPGFGSRFGGVDRIAGQMTERLSCLPGAGRCLKWAVGFSAALAPHGMGILAPGMASAAFADLGFQPRVGPGLFQLLNAPGTLAHGTEMANKPLTAMPFVKDEDYVIER